MRPNSPTNTPSTSTPNSKPRLQDSDRILGYNGETLNYYSDLRMEEFNNRVTTVDVLRDSNMVRLNLDRVGQTFIDEGIRRPFALFPWKLQPWIRWDVPPGRAPSGRPHRGRQRHDAPCFETVREAIQAHPETPIRLTVEREGTTLQIDAVPDSTGSLILCPPRSPLRGDVPHPPGTGCSRPSARIHHRQGNAGDYVRSMRFLFTSGASQVGSLVTFGSIFDAGWNWEVFWRNTAFFSLILAFMNLLPIPALDGGHVMFTLYGMIAGKPAPESCWSVPK